MALLTENFIPLQKLHICSNFIYFHLWRRTKETWHFAKENATLSCTKVCYADPRRHCSITDTHEVSESTWPARASSRRVRASGTTESLRQHEARPLRHVRHGEFSRPMIPDGHSRLPAYLQYLKCCLEHDGTLRKFVMK